MLCSDCGRVILPVAAVDIDGTLARYHEHFLLFAADYYDMPVLPDYDGSVSLAEWIGITKEEYRQCKLAYRLGGGKRMMPPYSDVAFAVNRMRSNGLEVWVTTTRPYLRLDNTDPDTRFWLERYGVQYTGLIYDEDKYSKLAEIVGAQRVIGVLEDDPEQYDRAAGLGLAPLLIQRQHNRTTPRPYMVDTLSQAAGIFITRGRGWSA